MPEDRPAFPAYAKEWIASTRGLSLAARGAYWDLLSFAWLDGSLSADPDDLRQQIGAEKAEWARIWPKLEPKWPERDGRRYNARLEFIREESRAFSESKSLAGKASARKRREQYGTAQPPNRTSNSASNTEPNRASNKARTGDRTRPEPASASAVTDQDTYSGDHSVAGIAPRVAGFARPPHQPVDRAVELAEAHAAKVREGKL